MQFDDLFYLIVVDIKLRVFQCFKQLVTRDQARLVLVDGAELLHEVLDLLLVSHLWPRPPAKIRELGGALESQPLRSVMGLPAD